MYVICAFLVLLTIVIGLVRIVMGPTAADRMLAAQLFGTSGVAILLLLAKGLQQVFLLDTALAFALLAALATITFIQRAWHSGEREGDSDGR